YRLLFKVKIISTWKVLGYALFSLIFISVTVGFIHGFVSDYPHFLEGEFGFWSNRLLEAQIGTAGVAGLLIFTIFTTLIVLFNFDFKLSPRRSRATSDPAGDATAGNSVVRNEERYVQESEYRVDPVEFSLNRAKEAEQQNEKLQQNVNTPKSTSVEDDVTPDFTVEEPPEKTAVKNEIKTPALTVAAIKEE